MRVILLTHEQHILTALNEIYSHVSSYTHTRVYSSPSVQFTQYMELLWIQPFTQYFGLMLLDFFSAVQYPEKLYYVSLLASSEVQVSNQKFYNSC